MPTTEIPESDLRRFWAKVAIDPSGCLLWTASRSKSGYGAFQYYGRKLRAHRFAYVALVGEIPAGLVLDHLCRVRHCVSPAHLEAVTEVENVRRGEGGRNHRIKTHCPQGHPYDDINTIVRPQGARGCRACERAGAARRRVLDRDKANARNRAYRAARSEEINAKGRAYWAANRDEISARRRASRETNREELNAKKRAAYAANREQVLARQRAARAAKKTGAGQ